MTRQAAPNQITGVCRHFGVCGGCDSQDKPYPQQLIDKESLLKDLFAQFDVKEFCRIIPSPEIYFYRNKMEYAVGVWDGIKVVGLRQKKRFYRVVALEECRIFNKDLAGIFKVFSGWIAKNNVEPYHNTRQTGFLRYLALRHSKYYDEVMATVVATSGGADFSGLIDEFRGIDKIKSLYLCVNNGLSDVAFDDDIRLLYGYRYIKERVNGIDYLISPDSFFQTNSYCCNELYGVIREEAVNFGGEALDVCCGAGGITLQVAGLFDKVTGVDISARNINDALGNAALNGIRNTEFICNDAEKFLLDLTASGQIKRFSAIILDPPRAGLSKKSRLAVRDSGVHNVIYVSCNPIMLAEDLKYLTQAYSIEKIIPVDMFPHTRHVEIIAILKANKV